MHGRDVVLLAGQNEPGADAQKGFDELDVVFVDTVHANDAGPAMPIAGVVVPSGHFVHDVAPIMLHVPMAHTPEQFIEPSPDTAP